MTLHFPKARKVSLAVLSIVGLTLWLSEEASAQFIDPLTLAGLNEDLRARADSYYYDYQPQSVPGPGAHPSQTRRVSNDAESRYRKALADQGYYDESQSRGGNPQDTLSGTIYGTSESANQIRSASRRGRVDDTYDESVTGLYPHMYRGNQPFNDVYGGVASFGRYGSRLNRRTLYGQIFQGNLVPDKTNMRIGAFNFKLGAVGGLNYTDNVFLTQDDKQSDILAQIAVTVGGDYQLSEINNINFYVSAGVGRYLLHKDSNERLTNNGVILNVAPDSYLAFDFNLGEVFISISDHLYIRQDIDNGFILDARDNYDTIINNFGVNALWRVNSTVDVTAGYNLINQWPLDDAFDFNKSVTNQFSTTLNYSPTGSWSTGVEAGYYHISYTENVNNDSNNVTFGPYLSVPISRYTQVRVAGGWQWGDYQRGGLNGDSTQLNSFYANLRLENQLNAYLQQSFGIGRGATSGVISNFTEQTWARYALTARLNQTAISGGVYIAAQRDSGGEFARDSDLFGVDVNVTHPLGEMLTLYTGYYFGNNDSDLLTSQYIQHRFNVDLAYPLNQDIDLIVGYRYNRADAEISQLSFTENRVGINLSYNF